MNKLIPFLFGILLFPVISQGQCPVASYSNPGTVCTNNPISFINTSAGAATYQWDFCGGDFSQPYSYAVDDPHAPNGPTSISLVYDSTNWYGFLFNQHSLTITRYDFGNSLDNTPDSVDLGNPGGIITGAFWNDMSFVKEGNNWYGIFGLDGAAVVVLFSFGPALDNPTPATSVYSNPKFRQLAFQDLEVDSGNLFLFIARDNAAQIYRLNYGSSITDTNPALDVIDLSSINPNYSEFGDISIVKYCNHWYGFVASLTSNSIIRLDFGNSLSNTPTVMDLGNPNGVLSGGPWSIKIAYDGDQWYGFEMNFLDNFNRIDFGKDLTNTSPTGVNLNIPSINGIGASVAVAKMNSTFYLFVCNRGGNVFSKIKYEAPCSVIPQVSAQQNPVVVFDSSGTYIVSLSATDSSGNVNFYSDTVHVNQGPTANFSFQNTCYNDVTQFQDLSYFNQGTITGRQWNFGDGKTDSVATPSHIYALPGKYAVTLTLTGSNGCNTALTDTVIIGAVPVANFSATAGCSNVPVQFTDSSTVGFGNSIVNWHWDFGNGDTSIVQNPLYIYPAGGNYTVILTVTTNNNCSSDTSLAFTISQAPQAGFYATHTCIDSTVSFIDSSTISSGSINAWHWDFGDGDTSLLQNPSHIYSGSVSTYSVTLIVKAADGCSDTVTTPVKINHVPNALFTYAPTTLCEGNTINFTDQSTVSGDSVYAWHWDFGNGDTSIVKNPVYAFPSYGTYTVVLTVYSQTSCGASDSATVTVIQSPTAGFTFNSSCLGDSTYFNDVSIAPGGTSIIAWHWDFGDGDTSDFESPVHLYDSAGVYTVSLLVTSNTGCINSYVTTDTIHGLPVASFAEGHPCTSTPSVFLNTSTSNYGAISTTSWNFGDPASGSNDTSTSFNAQHIYYQTGSYPVSLIITTVYGCTDTVALPDTVSQTSVAKFQYQPTCEQEQMIFTNLDSISIIDSTWSWSFGDGGVSYLQSPSHYYFLPGIYSVTLSVVSNQDCPSSITKQVEVSPNPVANFVSAPACINAPYSFQDISTVSAGAIQKWYWTFGNGDSSYIQSPQTIYTDTGDYIVSLTVTADTSSAACTNTVTQVIHVYPLPTANFNYFPLFGSPPLPVKFNDLSSGAAVYLWEFGDGDTSSSPNPSHTFTDTGKFSITEVVYSAEGCADSMIKTIYVITPRLDIAVTAVSYQLNNNLFKVSAQVANLGTEDIYSYDMLASIQDGATIDEHVNTPLPSGPGGIITYTFFAAFEVSAEQNINYYCVSALNPNGQTDDVPSNNEKCSTLSSTFSVVQPYPNPFSDELNLQFIIPFRGQVTVDMFDNIGQEIGTLYNDIADEGGTTFQVSTAALANGTFFCRFIFNNDQTLVYPIVKMAQKK